MPVQCVTVLQARLKLFGQGAGRGRLVPAMRVCDAAEVHGLQGAGELRMGRRVLLARDNQSGAQAIAATACNADGVASVGS